jgi:hypothetical protein
VLAGRQNPELKPVLIQELMTTRGRLQRAVDWTEFLTPLSTG